MSPIRQYSCDRSTDNLHEKHQPKLPAWIGDLRDVRRLMFGNNNLTTLPFKIGYLKNLEELQVFNNPLEYPPYELINEGMDQLQWALRRKYLEAVHGPSPVMNAHFYGIADEKIDLEPEFKDRIQQAVDKVTEIAAGGGLVLALQPDHTPPSIPRPCLFVSHTSLTRRQGGDHERASPAAAGSLRATTRHQRADRA